MYYWEGGTSVLPCVLQYFDTSVLPYFRTSVLPYFRTSIWPYVRPSVPTYVREVNRVEPALFDCKSLFELNASLESNALENQRQVVSKEAFSYPCLTYVHRYMRACVHLCLHAYVHVCVRACARAHVNTYVIKDARTKRQADGRTGRRDTLMHARTYVRM